MFFFFVYTIGPSSDSAVGTISAEVEAEDFGFLEIALMALIAFFFIVAIPLLIIFNIFNYSFEAICICANRTSWSTPSVDIIYL